MDIAFAACEAGDIDGAIAIYRQLIDEDYRNPVLHYSLGQLLLLKGDFKAGWLECERREKQRPMPFPRWRGQMLKGERLLIHGEQGFGDNIQFARYATLAARRGAEVVIATREGLRPLLSTIPGVAQVIEPGEGVNDLSFECPMLSLPSIFATGLNSIPADIPYLTANPERVQSWSRTLAAYPGPKVGLVWSGNTDASYNSRRSPGLDPFIRLIESTGATFFGLQMGGGHDELLSRRMPSNFLDLAPKIGSFDDSAAIMMNLDLVISSCTAPAHLAGALGRPLWVVLSAFPDWRWLLEREDNPWYPTARLFRQRIYGDWSAPFDEMRTALQILAGDQRT
jgi:ADP-heptose:LPS heptosyltransferase